MKSRTRTLTLIVATAASASVLTALALGGGSSAAPATPPTSTYVMPMTASGMTEMMGTTGTMAPGGMMSVSGMDAMHDAMHQSLKGKVADAVLAACDKAHDAMATVSTDPSVHASHHMGAQP